MVLYEQDPANPFFSTRIMGSAQRLSNGNIVITLSFTRTLVEVNEEGEIVWEATINDGGIFIFKSQSYSVSYSGFQELPFNIAPLLKGDINLDGVVDFSDIPSFIAVLQSGVFQIEADTSCDTAVDFADIPSFIALLQSQ